MHDELGEGDRAAYYHPMTLDMSISLTRVLLLSYHNRRSHHVDSISHSLALPLHLYSISTIPFSKLVIGNHLLLSLTLVHSASCSFNFPRSLLCFASSFRRPPSLSRMSLTRTFPLPSR